eukprot:s1981_g13.t1
MLVRVCAASAIFASGYWQKVDFAMLLCERLLVGSTQIGVRKQELLEELRRRIRGLRNEAERLEPGALPAKHLSFVDLQEQCQQSSSTDADWERYKFGFVTWIGTESLWQRGLEEWEGKIAKYEREYGKSFDEDWKLAILSEVAAKALAPQIAMNSASLTSYKSMREFVVQYLKSKNSWKRSAGTIFGSTATSSTPGATSSGPVPMDVGALDGQDQAGKSKGKPTTQKGNPKGGKKGAAKCEGKGKEKGKGGEPSKKQQGKGAHCAICGPEKRKNHTTDECYFNARSNPKGDSKGGKKGSRNTYTVSAVDGTYDDTSVPSMLTTLQQQTDALKQVAAGQSAAPAVAPTSQKKTHQGASSADICFAVCHSRAKAVESDKPSERAVSH